MRLNSKKVAFKPTESAGPKMALHKRIRNLDKFNINIVNNKKKKEKETWKERIIEDKEMRTFFSS